MLLYFAKILIFKLTRLVEGTDFSPSYFYEWKEEEAGSGLCHAYVFAYTYTQYFISDPLQE